jgi:hypothetical protein
MVNLPDFILPAREYFGLSIDRTSIRGLQLSRSGQATHTAELTLPDGVFVQNIVTQPDVLTQHIQNLHVSGKFTTPYVVVCFPEAFAYTRELTLPTVRISEMEEAVVWHSERLFPFSQDEIYTDWKIIRKVGKETVLAVVAVQKNSIDPIVTCLLSAGLKPLRLSPDASTIARLLRLPQEKHAIVTEVNRTGAYVTLVEGENGIFTTFTPYGGDDTPVTYLSNVKTTITDISNYYHQKGVIKDQETVNIVLTGEVASESWLKELPKPSKLLLTQLRNPGFNKAYAAAMLQLSPPNDEETINLLPKAIQDTYDDERRKSFYQAIFFRTASYIGALLVFISLILGFVIMQRQEIDMAVKHLSSVNDRQNADAHNLLSINALAKQIITLAPYRKNPHDKLEMLLTLIPEGVTVAQVDYDDSKQQYSVTGVAQTREILLDFKDILEKSPQFAGTNLPISSLESPTNIQFSISFVNQ